ncbi:MAG TPA: copper-containing nitrite reductase [Anaerolineae bacterium]|nr:copper-containing nitrite reductase [Anaerolineae bacterium]
MNKVIKFSAVLTAILLMLSACNSLTSTPTTRAIGAPPGLSHTSAPHDVAAAEVSADTSTALATSNAEATVEYTLTTSSGHDGLGFMGVGGEIDGAMNPTLKASPGDVVAITLINGDGLQHNFTLDEFGAATRDLLQPNEQQTITFTVDAAGEYVYYCAVPGHRQAGMWGKLQVGEIAKAVGASIVRNPTDLPAPIGDRGPTLVRVDLTTQEVVGQLADGTTYTYFTFDGKVPGPMLRVRSGDTVELHLQNDAGSAFAHSIDLHAVTGPGGGAVHMQTKPGEETVFTFQALNPGLYVYHCATPSVPHHIASGMYGLILVEPEGGLPQVDREFYVMQGEIYSEQAFGTPGQLDFSAEKLSIERPEYFVFNGAAGALTTEADALKAQVGETVRIFFGVGGPNYTSSFHVIGEIFDRAYPFAALTSAPLTDVQTISVPPGGAGLVEFKIDAPGKYILVDHALSRLERGLAGALIAEGDEQPEIFHAGPATP